MSFCSSFRKRLVAITGAMIEMKTEWDLVVGVRCRLFVALSASRLRSLYFQHRFIVFVVVDYGVPQFVCSCRVGLVVVSVVLARAATYCRSV